MSGTLIASRFPISARRGARTGGSVIISPNSIRGHIPALSVIPTPAERYLATGIRQAK